MSVVVRRATLGDRRAIQDFIAETYGSLSAYKGEARWEWQFLSNPARMETGESVPVWIAEDTDTGREDTDTGRVVGQIALQEGRLRLNGHPHHAGWIVDVMVHPDFRGQGLGHRIHEAIAAEMTTLVTLTMAPATRRIAERHGCITLGPVYQFNKIRRTRPGSVRHYILYRTQNRPRFDRAARVLCDRFAMHHIAAPLLTTASRTALSIGSFFGGRANIQIEQVNRYTDADDRFLSIAISSRHAHFERNAKAWNWRFCDAPDLQYERFRVRKDDRVIGQLIMRRCTKEEFPIGTIVELLTEPGDQRTAGALLRFACKHFADSGVEAYDAAASTPEMIRLYTSFGFLPTRRMRPTVVCSDQALAAEIERAKNAWYFSKADHDWDQIHVADPIPSTPRGRS